MEGKEIMLGLGPQTDSPGPEFRSSFLGNDLSPAGAAPTRQTRIWRFFEPRAPLACSAFAEDRGLPKEAPPQTSTPAIDITTVSDSNHEHQQGGVLDGVENSVVPDANSEDR